MKQLLSLVLIATIFVFSSGFITYNGDKDFEADNNRVEVRFNNQLEFRDVVKIKLDMAKKGVILDYKKLQFDEDGKLIAIDFSVDFKDGFSGSASSDDLKNYGGVGFFRDYNKKANSPFGTGSSRTF